MQSLHVLRVLRSSTTGFNKWYKHATNAVADTSGRPPVPYSPRARITMFVDWGEVMNNGKVTALGWGEHVR